MHPVSLAKLFDTITEYWSPKIVARVNDQYIKIAKVKGELAWHKHDDEDEMFQVIKGQLVLQFEDGCEVTLEPGELYVVPKGVMHNPVAETECWIMLVETVTTRHTGDFQTPLTKTIDQQLS
ncbi:MAG TPA: cupin domain-containing protein [Rhizomicrobium sp.]|nr:cupin domain-containing protein [Rhizomicrobium sp.]